MGLRSAWIGERAVWMGAGGPERQFHRRGRRVTLRKAEGRFTTEPTEGGGEMRQGLSCATGGLPVRVGSSGSRDTG